MKVVISIQPSPWGAGARRQKRAVQWLERSLWLLGVALLGYFAFIWGLAQYAQWQGNHSLDRLSDFPAILSANSAVHREGSLIGRMAIPRLELNAVVFEGTSEQTLTRGVGHLSGTAGPGEPGNLVLAGHRDTFFRKLRGIKNGDEVILSAPEGESKYRVESTFVVMPDQIEVLSPTDHPTLTLITCFPFSYIGSAPKRFIVRAAREDAALEPPPVTLPAPRSRRSAKKATHRRIG